MSQEIARVVKQRDVTLTMIGGFAYVLDNGRFKPDDMRDTPPLLLEGVGLSPKRRSAIRSPIPAPAPLKDLADPVAAVVTQYAGDGPLHRRPKDKRFADGDLMIPVDPPDIILRKITEDDTHSYWVQIGIANYYQDAVCVPWRPFPMTPNLLIPQKDEPIPFYSVNNRHGWNILGVVVSDTNVIYSRMGLCFMAVEGCCESLQFSMTANEWSLIRVKGNAYRKAQTSYVSGSTGLIRHVTDSPVVWRVFTEV